MMRQSVVDALETRDGTSDKDGRFTNVLAEQDELGPIAVVRPGLRQITTTTGNGNGIISFNNRLLAVYGVKLKFVSSDTLIDISDLAEGEYDFTQSTL